MQCFSLDKDYISWVASERSEEILFPPYVPFNKDYSDWLNSMFWKPVKLALRTLTAMRVKVIFEMWTLVLPGFLGRVTEHCFNQNFLA